MRRQQSRAGGHWIEPWAQAHQLDAPDLLGLSKERVRQLQELALEKLRFTLTLDPILQ